MGAVFSDRSRYQRYVQDLESLRKRTGIEITEFYLRLIAAPLSRREELVVQWIISENPSLSYEKILSQMNTVFERLKR